MPKTAVHTPKWTRVVIPVRSLPPGLLQNKMRAPDIEKLIARQLGLPAPKDETQYTREDFCAMGVHALTEPMNGSTFGHPANSFFKAMIEACPLAKEVKTRITKAVRVEGAPGGMLDLVPLKTEGWKVHQALSVNEKTRGGASAIVVFRPHFPEWEAELPIQFDAATITDDRLVNLVNLAGQYVGIGSWRWENKGPFGRFEVVTQKN